MNKLNISNVCLYYVVGTSLPTLDWDYGDHIHGSSLNSTINKTKYIILSTAAANKGSQADINGGWIRVLF